MANIFEERSDFISQQKPENVFEQRSKLNLEGRPPKWMEKPGAFVGGMAKAFGKVGDLIRGGMGGVSGDILESAVERRIEKRLPTTERLRPYKETGERFVSNLPAGPIAALAASAMGQISKE